MKHLLKNMMYFVICHLGSKCRRNFDPNLPCCNCERTYQQTRYGKKHPVDNETLWLIPLNK